MIFKVIVFLLIIPKVPIRVFCWCDCLWVRNAEWNFAAVCLQLFPNAVPIREAVVAFLRLAAVGMLMSQTENSDSQRVHLSLSLGNVRRWNLVMPWGQPHPVVPSYLSSNCCSPYEPRRPPCPAIITRSRWWLRARPRVSQCTGVPVQMFWIKVILEICYS